jgi:hypothetical protein
MNSSRREEKLRRILGQAYRKREDAEVGGAWRDSLMNRLRQARGPEPGAEPYSVLFAQFTWRLAPFVVASILVLSAFLARELGSGDVAFQILLNGTEELNLTGVFS